MKRVSNTGLAVDSGGNPVIDPTENVKALTEAATLRQDDLRQASDKYNQAEIGHVKEQASMRASYEEKLSLAESKRIDAIRAVDVNAVAIANERSAAAAQVLANSVSSLAANIAEQQKQIVDQINVRISAIERSQYEGQGKGSVTDQQLAALVDEVRKLNQISNQTTGRSEGNKASIALILGIGALFVALIFGILNYINT